MFLCECMTIIMLMKTHYNYIWIWSWLYCGCQEVMWHVVSWRCSKFVGSSQKYFCNITAVKFDIVTTFSQSDFVCWANHQEIMVTRGLSRHVLSMLNVVVWKFPECLIKMNIDEWLQRYYLIYHNFTLYAARSMSWFWTNCKIMMCKDYIWFPAVHEVLKSA